MAKNTKLEINIDELSKKGVIAKISGYEIFLYTQTHTTLSHNMPILENLGLVIDNEVFSAIKLEEKEIFLRKYVVTVTNNELWENSKQNLADVIESAFKKEITNSPLNSLAYLANQSKREISLVKSIASYLDQLIPVLSEHFIDKTLVKYSELTKLFNEYFDSKFKPDLKNREQKLKNIEKIILEKIKTVENISEDRVLRIFFQIIYAATRTNYYFEYEHIAFKVDVTKLSSELKGLQPKIESFVYHPKFAGAHLRRSKISRGGIRYSDRNDDYRNEIKDLMKAQRSKNSIIVPSGAKGGFIIHEQNPTKEEFIRIYESYINSLLDLVDNRKDNEIVRDSKIVAYDDEDTYFVVAADKGTAHMSDIANSISTKRGFWLGDAFASGGSSGYNHKEMGITAKGSIKSTERFFIELGKNFYETQITIVGIGSPSGDVFGNGMLLSENFLLIAAISSKEIFIDPEPNAQKAFKERKRLFNEQKGWAYYDKELISNGGGIFKKNQKIINLTPEIKKLFNIKKDVVDGLELARYILCAKVDMLFNGGVGTYVKATNESDSAIGDKPNEDARVNAKDIKAYCVCEGGNLGFTQKARIEYAKNGGKINMDAIDNSAGVHTSDIEVNLKIILNSLVLKGIIHEDYKIELLKSMASSVETTVLWTNYFQSLAVSLDELRSKKDIQKFIKTINVLEAKVDNFDRAGLEIPSNDDIGSVQSKNGSLLRPILSSLLSYSKIFLKSFLKKHPAFLESDFLSHYIFKYFPKAFSAIYKNEVLNHPLKNEIIATLIANKIINALGSSFIFDACDMDDERFLLKISSFLLVNELYSANDIRFELFREDYRLNYKKQYELFLDLDYMINFSIEWILERGEYKIALKERIREYKKSLFDFIQSVDNKYINNITEANEKINRFFSLKNYIQMALTVISVKESTKQDFAHVATLFFTAAADLDIFYITNTIKDIQAKNEWENRLKDELEKSVFSIIFHIIEKIMNFKRPNETIEEAYKMFVKINEEHCTVYLQDLKNLKSSASGDIFTSLSVVINSLKKIIDAKD